MFTSNKMAVLGGDSFRDEYSLAFDGTNDYMIVADAASLSFDAFSSVGWIKLGEATSCPIITKGIYNTSAEYAIKLQSDDKLHFWVADESVSSCHIGRATPVLTSYEGQWIHFACTYDGGTASSGLKIYINGSQVDDANDEGNAGSFVAMEDLAADVHIARYGTSASASNFGGLSISDLAIYDKELTQGEVLNVYNGREPFNHKTSAFSGNLTAWWRMGDGTGDNYEYINNEATGYSLSNNLVVGTDTTFAGSGNWTGGGGGSVTPNYDSGDAGHDTTLRIEAGSVHTDRAVLAQSNLSSTTVAGQVYLVTFWFKHIEITDRTDDAFIVIGNHQKQNIPRTASGWTYYKGYFTAVDNSTDILVYVNGTDGHADNETLIDDFSIQKIGSNAGTSVNMASNDMTGDTP